MTDSIIRAAIVIGGTGLVGRALIHELAQIASCKKILVLCRQLPKNLLVEQKTTYQYISHGGKVRWQLQDDITDLSGVLLGDYTHAYSCLGTTLKKAGSKQRFYEIDYELNLKFAQAVRPNITHFAFVSALGANPSSLFFYNQVKGKLEQAIIALNFEHVTIVRPSLLLGARDEQRFLEDWSQRLLSPLLTILPKKIKQQPIAATQVAHALVIYSQRNHLPVQIYDNLSLFIEASASK